MSSDIELIPSNEHMGNPEAVMQKRVDYVVKAFEIKFADLLDNTMKNGKLSQKAKYNLANAIQIACLFAAARLLRPSGDDKIREFVIKRNLETFQRVMNMVYKTMPNKEKSNEPSV